MGGCDLSRHQCGFARMESDCTRLAGEEEVVGWYRWWWWVVAAAAIVSCRREARAEVRAGSRSLSGEETDRDSLQLREAASGNTRGIERNTVYGDTGSRVPSGVIKQNNNLQLKQHINTLGDGEIQIQIQARQAASRSRQLRIWLNFASAVSSRPPRPVGNHILTHTCLIYL